MAVAVGARRRGGMRARRPGQPRCYKTGSGHVAPSVRSTPVRPYHHAVGFALAKIQPPSPRRGQWLARPALEQRLRDAVASHRAVLVWAAAGFGKTALLVRALAPPAPGHGLAWVSLDPGDDLHRLLECLLAALDPFDLPLQVAPEGLLSIATSGDAGARQRAVDTLVDAMAAAELEHGTIVLDDLHHLDDASAGHLLTRLVERLPARWTLLLASRERPAGLLARTAAAGELATFRENDLAFGADEVRRWCAGLGLAPAAADSLFERTAGWAAGLRLLISGAQGATPGAAVDRAAFDFLATEVLAHLEIGLRRFLLDTSVLHELDPARCEALTGDPHCARWLDEVERRGLFASVVDEATGTLRLHDLFREALQHRLRIERPEDRTPLLVRAATLETDPLRRMALWAAAGRHDDAAHAMLAVAPGLNTDGAMSIVQRMLDTFPPRFAATSAEWHRVNGYVMQTRWRHPEAEHHLQAAETLYLARGDHAHAQSMRARRACVLIALGRLGDAGVLLDELEAAPLAETEARLQTATAAGWHAMERGDCDAVAPAFARLVRLLQDCRTGTEWASLPSPRQTACRGMAPLVLAWAQGALAIAGDRPVPLRTWALMALGWRALWLGRFAESQARLDEAMGDARWGGHEVISQNHGLALQAALALVRGAGDEAVRWMARRLAEQPAGYGGWGRWHALYFAARIAAAAGDRAALRDGLDALQQLQQTLPDATPQRLLPTLGLRGHQAALDGDTAKAQHCWIDSLAQASASDLLGQAAELRVRLAWLQWQSGARDDAAATLAVLLDEAADGPRGAVFAGDALQALARLDWADRLAAPARATLQAWATAAAEAQRGAPAAAVHPATAEGIGADPTAGHVGPSVTGEGLSERELEVVALIARGQSNKLIARALDLSPHTVKRHVANTLAKLGLASRGEIAAWYHTRPGR